jgi:hypothetical protein
MGMLATLGGNLDMLQWLYSQNGTTELSSLGVIITS